jgi:glycosyltransferase involved in cell wall biosynthesis
MRSAVNPILSVILPVYNAEKYVAKAIESILNQTFGDFELIIADDGSKDGSSGIVNTYARQDDRIIISHNEINQGKVKTVNRIFEICRGKYVTVHDADDWSEPSRFEAQLKELESNPKVGFCGTNYMIIGRNVTQRSNLLFDPELIKKEILLKSQFHGPTIIFRKNLIESRNVYRVFFDGYGEDYDLCLRLIEKLDGTNLKGYLYHYNITPGSLSRDLTPRKLFSHEIAIYLAEQRRDIGQDDLANGNIRNLEKMIENRTEAFNNDPSLIFQKRAEQNMYYCFYLQAIRDSFIAIRLNPYNFKNFRTAQYCIRKFLFRR